VDSFFVSRAFASIRGLFFAFFVFFCGYSQISTA
jgi:hypothetical protein